MKNLKLISPSNSQLEENQDVLKRDIVPAKEALCTGKSEATTGWVSRRLFDLLIEQKNYVAAAKCVSESETTFVLYSQMLLDTTANFFAPDGGKPLLDLRQILDAARDVIEEHEKWQAEILENLSEKNLAAESLQEAFRRSAIARNKLLEEMKGINWMRAVAREARNTSKYF